MTVSPPMLRPMLASPGEHVPQGPEWQHEVKWDGMRILAAVDAATGQARLTSRAGNVVTAAWPDVATTTLRRDLVVDGEVIALNEQGVPDFRVLQQRMHVRRPADIRRLLTTVPATYMAFDLLRLDGRDLTGEPLEVRRRHLARVLADTVWQVPQAYDDGDLLYSLTRDQGLEGIVSKKLSSRYLPGDRSRSWLKFPHRYRGSYVIGGWRPQEDTTDRLASLLVGEQTASGLLYRGRVGSGIGPQQSRVLAEAVAGLERTSSPFDDDVPTPDTARATWLEPVLVVEIESHGFGHERLRQPTYQGLRTDLRPEDLS